MPAVRSLVASLWFGNLCLAVIVLNAVVIGVETYRVTPLTQLIQTACVWFFVAELALRFIGRPSTREYVRDGWNWFDLVIVGSAFVPEVASLSTVLRILRVLRVLRLVRSIPELRLIVSVLTRSIASMTYIGLLMLICFFIYAAIGVKLFGTLQPEFASLHEAFFTLFGSLTLEGWTDVRHRAIELGANYWVATLYHGSWVVIATFLLVNLIVGAIINNYQEVQEIERRRRERRDLSDERILELSKELHSLLRERSQQQNQPAAGVRSDA